MSFLHWLAQRNLRGVYHRRHRATELFPTFLLFNLCIFLLVALGLIMAVAPVSAPALILVGSLPIGMMVVLEFGLLAQRTRIQRIEHDRLELLDPARRDELLAGHWPPLATIRAQPEFVRTLATIGWDRPFQGAEVRG